MILSLSNVTKFYGNQKVLNNFSIHLNKGEIYGLLGANGAGKTTTINIICGLLNYNQGEVLLNGEEIGHQTKYLLGIATQENLLYSQLSCQENLRFFGKIYGLTGTKLKSCIYESLNAVNLLEQKDQTVANLSGGMQRRLNIALAIIHHPQLLILDEPTTGLDIEVRYDIWQLILRLKEQGMTILLTTHLLDEAEKLCDRIGIMKKGTIIKEGSLEQLRQIVPAKEIVFIATKDEQKAIAIGKELGIEYRYYQGELAFLMKKNLELQEILQYFQDLEITSIHKELVTLEHIYLETMSVN